VTGWVRHQSGIDVVVYAVLRHGGSPVASSSAGIPRGGGVTVPGSAKW